jgi:hypothetical protein
VAGRSVRRGGRADAALDELLAELDLVEGVDQGHYERAVVTTIDGALAWAWSTLQDTGRYTPIDAWTTLDER